MTSEEIMSQYKEKEEKALEDEKRRSERQKKSMQKKESKCIHACKNSPHTTQIAITHYIYYTIALRD